MKLFIRQFLAHSWCCLLFSSFSKVSTDFTDLKNTKYNQNLQILQKCTRYSIILSPNLIINSLKTNKSQNSSFGILIGWKFSVIPKAVVYLTVKTIYNSLMLLPCIPFHHLLQNLVKTMLHNIRIHILWNTETDKVEVLSIWQRLFNISKLKHQRVNGSVGGSTNQDPAGLFINIIRL